MKRFLPIIERWDRRRACLALMVVAAIAIRIAIIFHFRTYEELNRPEIWKFAQKHDHFSFGYETGSIAASIASGKGFSSPFGLESGPTAWIAPVYPYLCALIFRIFGVFSQTSGIAMLVLNSVFDAIACIYIFRIGERLFGRKVGWAAGWIWAVCLLFTTWSTVAIWDTSLSSLLLAIAIEKTLRLRQAQDRMSWLIYSAIWGVITLTNPSILAILPFCSAWLMVNQGIRSPRFLRNGLLAAAVFCALITPWLVRNRLVFHQWVFVRTNAGFEFSLGNFPAATGWPWYGRHPSENHWEFEQYRTKGEVAYIADRKTQAISWVRQNPKAFAFLTIKRCQIWWFGTLIDPETHTALMAYVFYSLSLGTIAGVWLSLRRHLHASFLVAGIVAFYPIAYYLTFVEPRYRRPVEPLMLICAMYAVFAPVEALSAWRAKRMGTASTIALDTVPTAAEQYGFEVVPESMVR
jgi:4-amino-4-deoxy-L-arabinose transferase-like glycosyltransferase